jgi:hypothetical protein
MSVPQALLAAFLTLWVAVAIVAIVWFLELVAPHLDVLGHDPGEDTPTERTERPTISSATARTTRRRMDAARWNGWHTSPASRIQISPCA